MKIYATRSCLHFCLHDGKVENRRLADGELYLRVLDKPGKECAVLASFPPPAENFLELCLLLDALCRLKTEIYLIITYFGYARQDEAAAGEPLSAAVIGKALASFAPKKVYIIHPHSKRLYSFLPHTAIYPFFAGCVKNNDIIIAPDHGALAYAKTISRKTTIPYAVMEKTRRQQNLVAEMILKTNVTGKRCLLVDDIIDTGGTIIKAAEVLQANGALSVDVYVTHGLFSGNAYGKLKKAGIRNITVTDTIIQQGNISIAPVIKALLPPVKL